MGTPGRATESFYIGLDIEGVLGGNAVLLGPELSYAVRDGHNPGPNPMNHTSAVPRHRMEKGTTVDSRRYKGLN